MSEKKQTAVQILLDKLNAIPKPGNADTRLLLEAIKSDAHSLLELERQQIIDAYKADNTSYWPEDERKTAAENYYNENYKP